MHLEKFFQSALNFGTSFTHFEKFQIALKCKMLTNFKNKMWTVQPKNELELEYGKSIYSIPMLYSRISSGSDPIPSFHRLCARFGAVIILLFIFQLFISMKDGKAVNCNGSEIIGSIHLKYGKRVSGEIVPMRNRTQKKSYPTWMGTISLEISYPGYHFTRDIVPRVRFLQRYRTLFLQCYFRILSSRKVHLHSELQIRRVKA